MGVWIWWLLTRRKELGVKQESYFHWVHWRQEADDDGWAVEHLTNKPMSIDYSAFTVAELGEMLPNPISFKGKGWWYCDENRMNAVGRQAARTEANARAKMLIYLFEHNLIQK